MSLPTAARRNSHAHCWELVTKAKTVNVSECRQALHLSGVHLGCLEQFGVKTDSITKNASVWKERGFDGTVVLCNKKKTLYSLYEARL